MSDAILMPSRRGVLILSGLGLLLAGCSTIGALTPIDGAEDETAAALPLVNRVRAERGLSPLAAKGAARSAAAEQAVRMAKAEQMTHLIGRGDDFKSRMKRRDVPLPAAENIASGQNSVEDAVDAWIRSQSHLTNMLGAYRGLGVAMARSTASRPYWAMVLSA
ncbi:MAG: CAP domain-containing protein [Alphaproteobacteria bacterium]|nr:CAP domain-containing protein [Alphaproteobacteria bacterium]MBU1549287.1 CAP domain-containing protein [Alphaproteobacteria bacterium]MBU2338384.1 CAP domain-containing protein [Alphaproteobacteria bacterium]MBU2388594.1 CAP domain-containing protein [Alphaproteobacteria bacterium]